MEEKTKSKNIIKKLLLFLGASSAISSAVAAGVVTAIINENSFNDYNNAKSISTQATTDNSIEDALSGAGVKVVNEQEVFNNENSSDPQTTTVQNPKLDEALEDAREFIKMICNKI